MVDGEGETVFDEFVKPDEEIISCITELTGIARGDLEGAEGLEVVLEKLKGKLPKDAVLVGQVRIFLQRSRDSSAVETSHQRSRDITSAQSRHHLIISSSHHLIRHPRTN